MPLQRPGEEPRDTDCVPFLRPTESRLAKLNAHGSGIINDITDVLHRDDVALISDTSITDADSIVYRVSEAFGLGSELELQAAYASLMGHRKNASKYFMTVNERADYQFIKPHSEGTSLVGMNLSALYCIENSTDGGETLLFNTDSNNRAWQNVREVAVRLGDTSCSLSAAELSSAAIKYKIDPRRIFKSEYEVVISSISIPRESFSLLRVLTPARKKDSKILQYPVYSCWDSVSSLDLDSITYFYDFLASQGLVKRPPFPHNVLDLEPTGTIASLTSGNDYNSLFKDVILVKLRPGDLVIQNNMTWAHSANNWTPRAGTRTVLAAFA